MRTVHEAGFDSSGKLCSHACNKSLATTRVPGPSSWLNNIYGIYDFATTFHVSIKQHYYGCGKPKWAKENPIKRQKDSERLDVHEMFALPFNKSTLGWLHFSIDICAYKESTKTQINCCTCVCVCVRQAPASAPQDIGERTHAWKAQKWQSRKRHTHKHR